MTVADILHEILTIAAGAGAAKWLHDEIDKLDAPPADPGGSLLSSLFLPAPEVTT